MKVIAREMNYRVYGLVWACASMRSTFDACRYMGYLTKTDSDATSTSEIRTHLVVSKRD